MLKFTKMEGLGNDYVYLDGTVNGEPEDVSSLARFVSRPHFGVGSDGLILILASDKADFRMKMLNKDGTEAEMCGNGIRCVGKFVYDKGLTSKTDITIETLGGIKHLLLQVKGNQVEKVTVDMGEPIFDCDKIPVRLEKEDNLDFPQIERFVIDRTFQMHCVSVGNPHAVTIVDNLATLDVEKYGSQLEVDPYFPNKSNIEFVELVDDTHIKMRVWERGSGETMACGTGATACIAVCARLGCIQKKATVELLGGLLEFEWDEKTNHIWMTGPARTVFEGELEQ